MSANYKASGEENLRADAHVYVGKADKSPGGSGKDAGGTANLKAETQTKTGSTKQVTTYSRNVKPAGVQTFEEKSV